MWTPVKELVADKVGKTLLIRARVHNRRGTGEFGERRGGGVHAMKTLRVKSIVYRVLAHSPWESTSEWKFKKSR